MNLNLSSTIHDLKNALFRITECPDRPSPEEVARVRDIALQACATLTNLLQMQRLEDDALLLNKELLDVDGFMQEVWVDAKAFCRHRCELEGGAPGELFMLDRVLITQVLINAVQNADRYAIARIVLRYQIDGQGRLVIDVHDDGPGFPDWVLQGRPGKADGSGVGLALGKAIVARHGGWVTLVNECGGVFRLELLA